MTDLTKTPENTVTKANARFVAPRVDIHALPEALVLAAEVPGVTSDGVDIQVEGGVLVLTAERKEPTFGKALFGGSTPAGYKRSFQLPDTVDTTKIEAKLERGVLEVTLPKRESLKPRQIKVQAS